MLITSKNKSLFMMNIFICIEDLDIIP